MYIMHSLDGQCRKLCALCRSRTLYTLDWQWPLSGVHPIMMEKSAQPGEGRGCSGARPSPFTISTITYNFVIYAPAQKVDTLPLFIHYPYMYSVVLMLLLTKGGI